jgi:hypothetical protein
VFVSAVYLFPEMLPNDVKEGIYTHTDKRMGGICKVAVDMRSVAMIYSYIPSLILMGSGIQ